MNIAILGATSQIAKDLIILFLNKTDYQCALFSRSVEKLQEQFSELDIDCPYGYHSYEEFESGGICIFDVIINFVGIGDPAAAQKMGSDIFQVTERYDNMALSYIEKHPKTKYIFLSSGAVYGGEYDYPVDEMTNATFNINNLCPSDWYSIAKLYAEVRHRSHKDLFIVDIRVFNYFSNTQNMNARFLITDIVRSTVNKETFNTSSSDIVRDFVTPVDFYHLIQAVINSESVNMAVDCYTKSPVSKFDLLKAFNREFGLNYVVRDNNDIVNATGFKKNYYSTSRAAGKLGYLPQYSSLEGVMLEAKRAMDR